MATPHVSGVMALVKGYYPDDVYWQTIQRITLNGDDVEALHDVTSTGKRLNVYKAILSLIPPAPIVTATPGTYEDRVEVSWKPVKGATYYKLWRRWSEGGVMKELTDWTTDLSYVDTEAEPKVGWHYYVRCSKHADGHDASPVSPAGVGYKLSPILDDWDSDDDTALGATILTPTADEQVQSHSLSQWDGEDWFRVAVSANQTYVFETTGAYDLVGELYKAASTNETDLLVVDDDSGTNDNFKVIWTPTEDGTVFLRVRAFDTSRAAWYQLKYSIPGFTDEWDPADDVAATATVLTPAFEEQTHGLHALSGTDTEDFFAIEMEAGKTYVFATTGDTDTFGELYKGATDAGSLVAWNDDGMDERTGNDLNFRLVYKPTVSGTYYLRVKLAPSGGTAGTYNLTYALTHDTYDLVFTQNDVVEYVKDWKVNGFFATEAEAIRGTNVFLVGEQVYLKWAFNETNFVNVAENITNLVELLNREGKRAAWGHAVCLNGLSEDEFYDFTTELPLLPPGAYVMRLTLNKDIHGNASVPEVATKDNIRVRAFNVVASAGDVEALEISGNATLAAKESVQYVCQATYGDERIVDVAPAWSIEEGADLATVEADGTVTVGNVTETATITLRAVFGGQIATKVITVMPSAKPASSAFPEVITYPNAPMTVHVVVQIDGLAAEAGDEVAAYCGPSVRGTVKLNAQGEGDLSISLAYPGENVTFKVWDASSGDEGAVLTCSETLYGIPGSDYGTLVLTCATDDPFGNPAAGGDWTGAWQPAQIKAQVTINGEPASPGDILAVYADGKLVGKQIVALDASFGGAATTARCDVNVYIEEEVELSFLVWHRALRRYYSCATKATLAPGATLGSDEERFLVEATDQTTLQIVLPNAGWHLVSFNVLPVNPRPSVIFTDPNITMVRFEDGKPDWRPGDPDDDILLEIGKGYWVHTCNRCKWSVTGNANPDAKIELVEGWNLIGYTLEREGRVEDVLRQALNTGMITEVVSGAAGYPEGNLSTLQPGAAYWVCVSKKGEVTFHRVGMINAAVQPSVADFGPFDGSEIQREAIKPVRYQNAVVKIGNALAAYGDCVAIYDATNVLRAVARVENAKGRVSFPIYAPEGTALHAKVWNAASEDLTAVYPAEGTFTSATAGSRVTNLVITVSFGTGSGGDVAPVDPAGTNSVGTVTNTVPPATFPVTFNLGAHGTRTGGGELTQQVAFGAAAVAPTITCETGWAFSHWDQPLTNIRAARTITAKYREVKGDEPAPGPAPVEQAPKREVELSFNANGGDGKMDDVTFKYDGSNSKLVQNTFTRDGYTFLGWSTTQNGRAEITDASNAAGVAQVVGLVTNGTPTTLYATWGKNGFALGTGTMVANGGARVTVPIKIDTGRPLACASVRLAYDPNILVFAGAEKGEVAAVFDDDFIVTQPSVGIVSVSCFAASNVVAGAGTLATVSFTIREGTEGQFSDVTIADVQLADETSVKDVTNDDPVTTENGMVRVMEKTADVNRLENAQTVSGETTLATLDVMAGDGIAATTNRLPVIVTAGVTTSNATPVAVTAPRGGWQGGNYQLLKTPTSGLAFNLADVPLRVAYVVTEDRADGMSIYQVSFSSPAEYTLEDEEGALSKLKLSQDFFVSLALDNPSPSRVNEALQQAGENGMKRWQNYLLGLNSDDAAAKIVLQAPRTAERTKIRLAAPNVVPVKDAGVAARFRLQKSDDGGETWIDVGDPQSSPTFDLDVTADPTGLYRVKTEFSTPQ